MLEERQPGIVEGDVGGTLRHGPRWGGYAGQSRREEDNAHWTRHRAET